MKRDALIEVTSKLPLAGRHGTREMYLMGREAAHDRNLSGKAGGMVFLGVMAALHAAQTKFGIDAFLMHAHEEGVLANAEMGYDGMYALVNSAVTYTQARLLGKLAFTRGNSKKLETETVTGLDVVSSMVTQEKIENHSIDAQPDGFTIEDLPRDTAVTLAGQAIFIATVV